MREVEQVAELDEEELARATFVSAGGFPFCDEVGGRGHGLWNAKLERIELLLNQEGED